MRYILLGILLTFSTITLSARGPLYVVNGKPMSSIESIDQSDIESIDVLPADEQSIALWGPEACEGVIIVTLRYDTAATFSHEHYNNFTEYLAQTVKWDDMMPAERVSLRISIDTEGRTTITEVLQSTSKQFLRRVTKAMESAPSWTPAMRDGTPVESQHLVNLQLPKGKSLPVEHGIIII